MKKIIILLMMCLPVTVMAQNTWELPETESGEKTNPDAKYLAGAVPVVDGKVTFETTIEAPGKTAKQIYDIMLEYLRGMTKEENQFEQSRIAIADSVENEIVASYMEWLVFKDKALVLDRTRFAYTVVAQCSDGVLKARIYRIYYIYDENQPQVYKAEDWITDEYGLKKNKEKLSRVSGRFRRKTIDRKDYLFNKFASLLK